ncbi:pre-toxin TG domain-containing protein [Sinorhizobium terangae]|uniref:pre-toxin TG domain-containing protein n=1 Tax=Sinorhizobium terangae TaxID=110322 RepID=UPI0024B0A126|nr:pre-toxin TG domain-containing protein [Sinorhizobium terangae]WFU50743.1 pre-toxin TG domain-containing protein [Sinorhizobium terangae]
MGDGFSDRMCSAPLTEDRMCYAPGVSPPPSELERFRQALPEASKVHRNEQLRALLPSPQVIAAERRSNEADFKKLLLDAGLTEKEFEIVVVYAREQFYSGVKLSEEVLEDRIRALHPPPPRFPGTVDPRGYNVGVMPRTQIAFDFFLSAAQECLKPQNFLECFGTALSLALDFMPVIGNIKGLIEAYTGRDLITGDKIPDWARCLNVALAVLPGAGAAWKAIRAGLRAAQRGSKAAVKAVLPIAMVVAVAKATPAESMQIIKNVAGLNRTVLRTAAKEAEKVSGGVLSASKAQDAAVRELSRVLSAEQVADIEKAISQKAAKAPIAEAPAASKAATSPAPPTPKPQVPGMPGAVPGAGSGGSGGAGRRPRKKTPGKTGPKALSAAERTKAYKDVGFERRNMPQGDQYKPWGRYQVGKTGKNYEQAAKLKDGREVRIDDLEINKAAPETLDLVDYKHSKEVTEIADILKKSKGKYDDVFFKELEKSGHYQGFAGKIDQFLRQAQLILENPKALGQIIIRCSDSRTAHIYRQIVDNLYGNIFTKVGRKWVKSEGLEKIIDAIKIEVVP